MTVALRPLFTFLTALCLGAPPALAAPAAPQSERLIYVLQFGGLSVADVMISLDETPGRYRTAIKLQSRGFLAMFKTFTADMSGEGELRGRPPAAQPSAFRREWVAGEMESSLHIAYDPISGLASPTERIINRESGETKRREDMPWNKRHDVLKPVPASLRTQVLDPMAAFIAAREMIRSGDKPVSFTVPIYDGLRRYNVVGHTEAAREMTVNDQTRALIAVKGKVEPVFGFDESLNDRVHEGEGKILFTADSRFLPVQIMVGNSMGVGVLNLTADCRVDPAACEAFSPGQEQALVPAGN